MRINSEEWQYRMRVEGLRYGRICVLVFRQTKGWKEVSRRQGKEKIGVLGCGIIQEEVNLLEIECWK